MTEFERLYAELFVGVLIISWVAWFVFSFFSMRRIERSIMGEGKPRPFAWDGIGVRVFGYALRVALPAKYFQSAVERGDGDVLDVKKYATRGDRIRAWALIILMHTMVLMVLVGIALGL